LSPVEWASRETASRASAATPNTPIEYLLRSGLAFASYGKDCRTKHPKKCHCSISMLYSKGGGMTLQWAHHGELQEPRSTPIHAKTQYNPEIQQSSSLINRSTSSPGVQQQPTQESSSSHEARPAGALIGAQEPSSPAALQPRRGQSRAEEEAEADAATEAEGV
jgi:hypothetical protein